MFTGEPVWELISGEKVKVSEMTNEHLINAIKWLAKDECYGTLKKQGISDLSWTKYFINELQIRKYNDL